MAFPPCRALLACLATLAIGACRSAAAPPQEDGYVLAFLVRGPSAAERTPEEKKTIQAAHLANIGRLAKERKLVVAGPFGKPVPDESLRGIFVFATSDLALAREWTSTDPAVQAGTLGMELAAFRTQAPLRAAIERDLADQAERAKAGKELDPAASIRGYVMVLARDPARAREGLTPLREQGKVLVEGSLDDSPRAAFVAVLDAPDVAAAETLLGSHRAEIGDHDLASWWASRSLEGLGRP